MTLNSSEETFKDKRDLQQRWDARPYDWDTGNAYQTCQSRHLEGFLE